MFEPRKPPVQEAAPEPEDRNALIATYIRPTDRFRCKCEQCEIMDKEEACLCCTEVPKTMEKKDLHGSYKCITNVPAFTCLCVW
jgi:hypothetical protein